MIGPGWARLGGTEHLRHCTVIEDLLEDLLVDPPGGDRTAAHRGHLDRCACCRKEIEDAVLMGIAVRRTMAAARLARPPGDSWPSLRSRIERQRAAPRRGRAASPVLGAALAAGLAIALLIPLGLTVSSREPIHEAGVDPAAIAAAGHRDAEAEARYVRAAILAGKEASSDDDIDRAREALLRVETDPAREWRVPSRNPLTARAR